MFRQLCLGVALRGSFRPGKVWQDRYGAVWRGMERQCKVSAGEVRHGETRFGLLRFGWFRQEWFAKVLCGVVVRVELRYGMKWQEWLGSACSVVAL